MSIAGLIRRLVKGSPLTAAEHDNNLDLIEQAIEAGVGDQVTSVAGKTGDVTLEAGDIEDFDSAAQEAVQASLDLKAPIANPTFTGTVVGITKSMVGLGNVDNTSDANKPISTAAQTALDLKANLVGGKVPADELPSYVDDVIEVANYAALPGTGETGKIYVTLNTGRSYRWSGSVYIEINPGLITSVAGRTGDVVIVAADLADFNTAVAATPPASHLHGDINNAGQWQPFVPSPNGNTWVMKISGAGILSAGTVDATSEITGLSDVATSGSYNDLSDTPTSLPPDAHAATHGYGGSDALTVDPEMLLAGGAAGQVAVNSGINSWSWVDATATPTADAIVRYDGFGDLWAEANLWFSAGNNRIAAPGSGSNRVYTLPDADGTVVLNDGAGNLDMLGTGNGLRCLIFAVGNGSGEFVTITTAATANRTIGLPDESGTVALEGHGADHAVDGDDAIPTIVETMAAFTANQNDLSMPEADIVRVSADAARDWTGAALTNPTLVINHGSYAITLKHENAGSLAANRFLVQWSGDFVLVANGTVLLIPDATTGKVRVA
jgi:hypothetical protein